MPKRPAIILFTLVLLTTLLGCSRPAQPVEPTTSASAPAPDPSPVPVQLSPPAVPVPPPAAVATQPVDWIVESFAKLPDVPLTAGMCTPDTTARGGRLQVRITGADWRVHPLSNGKFWAPAVVLTVCNAGGEPIEYPFLALAAGPDRDELTPSKSERLPRLGPGEGLGPIRLFSNVGVPTRISELWIEDGRRWPDWTIGLFEDERPLAEGPVRRLLGGTEAATAEAPGGAAELPDLPSLPLLSRLAWSKGTASPDGKRQVTIFLYTPDARYSIQETPYCGAAQGQIGAGGQQWAFYTSVNGAPPVRAAELGKIGFQGGRGMSMETVPVLNSTFLFFAEYASCAVPNVHDVYRYDHATGAFLRQRAQYSDGKEGFLRVGSYSFTKEGKLQSRYYQNASRDAGWHTVTYRWIPDKELWLFESDVRSVNP